MQLNDRIGRRLKLRDLNIFLAVVKDGGMSKAAAELAISQPAVSKSIADMEYTLGAPLLDRTPYGVEPTLYGRALVKRSNVIFDELRQCVKDIEFLADPTAGEVRIGSTGPLAGGIVAAVIERLNRRHPRISDIDPRRVRRQGCGLGSRRDSSHCDRHEGANRVWRIREQFHDSYQWSNRLLLPPLSVDHLKNLPPLFYQEFDPLLMYPGPDKHRFPTNPHSRYLVRLRPERMAQQSDRRLVPGRQPGPGFNRGQVPRGT